MCHPSDQEYMHVDKTWGIMPPSGMCPSVLGFHFLLFIPFGILIVSYCSLKSSLIETHNRPKVTLEEWSFLEKIFITTKLSEKSWIKLVTLDTLHWYYDGPKPTEVANHYDRQMHNLKSIAQYLLFLLAF